MEIVIVCGAMPFGADTLRTQSLGGSETAALMLGKELAERKHNVRMFCNQPPPDRPDAWTPGKASDGVTYVPLAMYQNFAMQAGADLIIIVRDPGLAVIPALAHKKVLWMHDIATHRGMKRAFEQMAWAVDEVWTVSEWHRQQVHEVTDYPLDHIVALRNGIVKVDVMPAPRSTKQLIYAARPERGLDHALEVMKRLPEYNLVVCMYDHFPEHMRAYYTDLMRRMKEAPNVQYLGPKPQRELRQLISESAAYLYPTEFEETSCILARECIEQATPFITRRVGALPETLGDCGLFFEQWADLYNKSALGYKPGTPEFYDEFANFTRDCVENEALRASERERMLKRTDLYWNGVAEMAEAHSAPKRVSLYSRVWSLMQDGDVIAARELFLHCYPEDPPETWGQPEQFLWHEIDTCYPFLKQPNERGYQSMADYYAWVYEHKEGRDDSELVFRTDAMNPRIHAVAQAVSQLPAGSHILEYGCGPGHLLAALAKSFPDKRFTGIEISKAAADVAMNGAREAGLENLEVYAGDLCDWPHALNPHDLYDAAIISEVLEHVLEPWDIAAQVEASVKPGGKMIITTPFGSWEQATIKQPGKWNERAHIWHLDPPALQQMFGHKPNVFLLALPVGQDDHGRLVGNTICTYDADMQPITWLDPVAKAMKHVPRQTTIACVIAHNNEDTILRMLESIERQVQFVNIALCSECKDGTQVIIEKFMQDRPWLGWDVVFVPKIEPKQFGFDDARNASAPKYQVQYFEWMLWIDTDEYLSGNFLPFLRNSAIEGYITPQHHFTVEPRGGAVQIDRPARLLRTDAGYKAQGHIHEHFIKPDGGVGRVFMLPNVDIGHTGYVNEEARRGRFARNFAFLEWDHEREDKPKLHSFLWFRDIVHRVRLAIQQNQVGAARSLAEEGLQYYNEHWKEMLEFGQGLTMSLQYVSELRNYMGQGVPIKVALQIEDQGAQFEGRFMSGEELQRLIEHVTKGELKDRLSRYW
jgi:glycosyltransferase involved in cell wall biosynthesis/SAM-dependent methyltransferase